MKKEYLKPEILVEEFILESMMMNTSPGGDKLPVNPDEEDEFTNDRRGGWGDLWN